MYFQYHEEKYVTIITSYNEVNDREDYKFDNLKRKAENSRLKKKLFQKNVKYFRMRILNRSFRG